MTATSSLVAVAGVFAITLITALIVLVNAELPVNTVARAAAGNVAGSFWVGLLWQLLAAPILLALGLACAITVVGLFLIPFVVLAWALAYAGAFTLGFTAVALVIGRAVAGRGKSTGSRAVALRSIVIVVAALCLVWIGAALLADIRMVGAIARLIAVALTWASLTVGLGAVVKSRGGMLTFRVEVTAERAAPSWQTPTPVAGVVAARRPLTTSTPLPGRDVTPDS